MKTIHDCGPKPDGQGRARLSPAGPSSNQMARSVWSAPYSGALASRRAELSHSAGIRRTPNASRLSLSVCLFTECLPMKTSSPRILTTTVGSYPVPDWLAALPSEQSLLDATRVIFNIQRQAGIDLPTDGELYRFDVNHPDTNGMIEYFVKRLGGVRREVGRRDTAAFRT